MNKISVFSFAGAVLLAGTASAVAQSRPNAHWGSFNKVGRAQTCLGMAENSMRQEHVEIWENGGFVRIGGNDQVIVEVACIPTGSGNNEVVVSAFSSDSATAERARNAVRQHIVDAVCFDQC